MTVKRLRVGAFAFAVGVALATGSANSQSPQPTPTPPSTPAQGGATPAPATPGPTRIDVTPLQPKWTKVCGKDQTIGKEVCLTSRDFVQDQNPALSIAVYQTTGEEKRTARLLLPVGLLLKPGFRVVLDKGEPIDGKYAICFPNFCVGELEFGTPTLNALRKAQIMTVQVRNQSNAEVTFVVPIKDFGVAFDGPAIDPKELQQQQQDLQKQLEDKAKQQREDLEKQTQQGVPPAPQASATPAK